MRLFRHTLALATLATGLLPAAAAAQNVHISRLYEQILENIEYANPGHELDSFGVVRMNAGEKVRIALDVPERTQVQVMGDCDIDCTDLDLSVYNGTGKLFGEDLLDDDYPIVSFTSDESGRIELELDLIDCGAVYCYTAYSVFVREN